MTEQEQNSSEESQENQVESQVPTAPNTGRNPLIETLGDDIAYDAASRRFFGRPIPETQRCKALKKNCECGYRFRKADLFDPNGERKKGVRLNCPKCGRERQRCANPVVKGTPVCRLHGGKGIAKKAFIPSNIHLDDDEIGTLEYLMEEDDISLKREFHTLRIFFGKALQQFKNTLRIQEEHGVGDVIELAGRLTAIVDKLASIAEKRERIVSGVPAITTLQFDDPRVQHAIKEALYQREVETITRVLLAVLKHGDPGGEYKLIERIPPSFLTYLPTDVVPEGVKLENVTDSGEPGNG